jgi:glutamate synthase (NADPH/NADH) large chain
MVDLSPLELEEELIQRLMGQAGDIESRGLAEVMTDMTQFDAERLYALIARHAHYTNSAKAKAILAGWRAYLPKFKKVMPVEYRRALAEMAKAQAAVEGDLGGIAAGLKAAKA